MSNGFQFDISDVTRKLINYESKVNAGLKLYGMVAASKMESYAKANRPWTDRTANAKQSITGTSDLTGHILTIQLSGGMDYSPYLEFAMNKQYAVLYPTLRKHENEILSGLRSIVGE